MEISKKVKSKIIKILISKNKRLLGTQNASLEKASFIQAIDRAIDKDRLVLSLTKDGEIAYFFIHRIYFAQELNQKFIYFSSLYCRDEAVFRKQFKAHIKNVFSAEKKKYKVKKMLVDVYADDKYLVNYFSKRGKETYRLLVGKTQYGVNVLTKNKEKNLEYRVTKATQKDVAKLVKLDRDSHLADKTSRLHLSLKKNDSTKLSREFYKRVIENKTCLVVKNKRGEVAGAASYFIDENHKRGLIASIFVTKNFQGKGVSKMLYEQMLSIFLKKKCKYYLGATTTIKVFSFSEKMKRQELLKGLIV